MKSKLSAENEKYLFKVYQNIRKIRTMLGFSQQYIADELGITQKHYSQIESGKVDISLSMLLRIAELLNITPTALLGISEERIFNNINNIKDFTTFSQHNAVDVNEIKQLYERLLLEKDKIIQQQKEMIDNLMRTEVVARKKV
jgi:transcriptional regulator with XRE-family HTH domain